MDKHRIMCELIVRLPISPDNHSTIVLWYEWAIFRCLSRVLSHQAALHLFSFTIFWVSRVRSSNEIKLTELTFRFSETVRRRGIQPTEQENEKTVRNERTVEGLQDSRNVKSWTWTTYQSNVLPAVQLRGQGEGFCSKDVWHSVLDASNIVEIAAYDSETLINKKDYVTTVEWSSTSKIIEFDLPDIIDCNTCSTVWTGLTSRLFKLANWRIRVSVLRTDRNWMVMLFWIVTGTTNGRIILRNNLI